MIGITAVFPVELPVALDDLAAVAEQPQRPSRYEPIEPHQDFGTEIVFERWHFVAVGRPARSAAHRPAKLGEAVLRLVEIARTHAFAMQHLQKGTPHQIAGTIKGTGMIEAGDTLRRSTA